MTDKIVYINGDLILIDEIRKHIGNTYKLVTNVNQLKKGQVVEYFHFDIGNQKNEKKVIRTIKIKTFSLVNFAHNINDKILFYDYVKQKSPEIYDQYLMGQHVLRDFYQLKSLGPKSHYIVKPVPGWKGKFIKTFQGKDTKKIKKHINEKSKLVPTFKKKLKWVIQRYIHNPLLWEDRKFHFRVVVLVYNNKAYMHKNFITFYAKKSFSLDDLSDDVHDTHGHTTPSFVTKIVFPKQFGDLEYTDEIYNKIIEMLKKFDKIGVFDYKCYPEHEKCSNLLGIDVMVTQDLDVKCLEINAFPGIKTKYIPNLMYGLFDLTLLGKKQGIDYLEL